jgi:anaerobic selenocysteine-containing dehydrogenase
VTGLDVVKRLVEPWTAERASASTEIPADTIRSLAQRFSSAPSAVCYGRIGTSVQAHGTVCAWLINVLNITTGNFDVPGGAMFPMPPFDPRWLPKAMSIGPGSYARRRTRVRSLPEAGGEFPVAALAEEILQPGPGQIRALVTFAGNPVLSTPNGTQLDRALEGLDVMISIDPYLNETTRHAHFILPPPSPLERLHFDVVFPMLAVRTVARHAEALFDPGPNARQDWQILAGLARRLARLRRDVRDRAMWRALETLGPRRLIDAGLRLGRFGGLRGLSLAKVAAHHHGLDLGPLEPALASKLRTPSGRLELAPKPLVDDVSRLEAALNASSASLVLINRRHQRDNNSWLHNVPKLVSGASRCTLLMHPEDAKRRNLVSGSWVGVRSRVGEIIVPIEVTDSVMPGVVSLPHGYGHSREGVRLRVATGRSGASVNDLSDELRVDTLSGNAAFSGLPVTVEPRDVPPISDGNGLH